MKKIIITILIVLFSATSFAQSISVDSLSVIINRMQKQIAVLQNLVDTISFAPGQATVTNISPTNHLISINNYIPSPTPYPIPSPVITTGYILDRFPNNTLLKTETGQSWAIQQGSFSINGGKLTGATTNRNIATLQFAEPFTMQADINTYSQAVFLNGFVIRYVDKDNYYMVKDNQDGNGFRIYERANGIDNLLVFASETLKGTLNVVVNNNKIIASIGSQSLQADMTKFSASNQHGVIIENSGNTLSNFIMWPGVGVQPPNPMNAFTLDYPSPYQTYQRDNGIGTIKIKGKIATQASPVNIEARFNNGVWNGIANNITDIFSGELDNQPQGQGNLDLRIAGTSITATISFVGIGDNYIVYGQSNAVGEGDNLQSYSNPTLKAGLFGNDYKWKELTDPFDSPVGQVDIVSRDPSPNASYWLPLATQLLATNVPVAFIPCCLGGMPISLFLPTSNHYDRNTLYGSMITRAKSVFGVKAVLFHQGESDAITNNINYKKSLEVMADAIFFDLGVKTYAAKIHWWDEVPTVTVAQVEVINNQISLAAVEDGNILTGPDFHKPTDITHRLHFDSNAALLDAATRWFNILTNPTK